MLHALVSEHTFLLYLNFTVTQSNVESKQTNIVDLYVKS